MGKHVFIILKIAIKKAGCKKSIPGGVDAHLPLP